MGRIKFKVKDFRTDSVGANCDSPNHRGDSISPTKSDKKGALNQSYHDDYDQIGDEEFSEEAVEIDCGVVDASQNDVQCKVCWSND